MTSEHKEIDFLQYNLPSALLRIYDSKGDQTFRRYQQCMIPKNIQEAVVEKARDELSKLCLNTVETPHFKPGHNFVIFDAGDQRANRFLYDNIIQTYGINKHVYNISSTDDGKFALSFASVCDIAKGEKARLRYEKYQTQMLKIMGNRGEDAQTVVHASTSTQQFSEQRSKV